MNKKVYNINDIRGVDITSSPINVAPYRASHMLNMISEGGTNVKRHGWQSIATFEHYGEILPINGIYEYRDEYVVHAGTYLYRCSQNFESKDELKVTGAEIISTKSKGYVRDGKLWIVGAGAYLVYDGDTIQPVMNSEYSYIPTTSIGIKDAIASQSWEYQGKSFQGVNLFNKRRINKLIGSDKTSSAYVLDGKIDTSQKVEINIATDRVISYGLTTLDPGSFKKDENTEGTNLTNLLGKIMSEQTDNVDDLQHYEDLYLELKHPIMINSTGSLLIEGWDKFTITFHTESEPIIIDVTAYVVDKNGEATNVGNGYYTERVLNKVITGITISNTEKVSKLKINGNKLFRGDINIKQAFNGTTFDSVVVTDGANELYCYPNFDPNKHDGDIGEIIGNKDGIKLSNPDDFLGLIMLNFSCPPMLEGDSNITIEYTADYESDIMISSSQEVVLSAGANVLCLVNNNNTVYFSDFLHGYGYFPDNDYIGIGKVNEPVTSIIALDRGIGIFNANELYLVNLNVSIIDKDFIVKIEPNVQGHYAGVGCDNEFLGLNVNGDTLIYNSTGVHGVLSTAAKVTNLRSTNVNKALCAYTMEQRKGAHAVSHQGRYYLFIEDKVYIADTRYKYYEGNRLDSGFEYEWWIWDGCECRCAYSFKDKLYMGTKDGEIRTFGEGYRDIIATNINADSNQLMYDGVKFSFDEALLVENEDSLTINNTYEILSLDEITRNYNKYYNSNGCTLNLSLRDFLRLYPSVISEDNEIILYDDIFGALTCTVKSIDIAKYTVQIEFDASKYNDSASYIIVRTAGTYKAKAIDNGDYVLVNELGEEIRFAGYEDISATLDKVRIVACEFRTGVIDFASLRSKTLYKLAFTPTRETSGKISLGYTTNLSSVKKERKFANTFDFLAYDFNKFAFDGGFFKTYMRRVFERGFNYIMFEFASLGDGPFGIESAQAIYSVNNELRSDR